jgi:hypothetical protein
VCIALLGVADWTTSTCFEIPSANSSEPSEPIEITVRASASDFVVTLELTAKHWEEALSKSPVAQAIVHEYLANWKRKQECVGECKKASKDLRMSDSGRNSDDGKGTMRWKWVVYE